MANPPKYPIAKFNLDILFAYSFCLTTYKCITFILSKC